MESYRVEIAIDVEAETPQQAAAQAWDLLTSPFAQQPVCDIWLTSDPQRDDYRWRVDLDNE